MAYWVLRDGQIVGPFSPRQLGELSDFSSETMVCPEEAAAGPVSRWVQAVAVDELREALMERRRRSRYWAYLSGRVVGPVPALELWGMEGFDSSVPVCPEGEAGRRRWALAGDLPELADLMPAPAGPRVGLLPPPEAPEIPDLQKLPAKALVKFLETVERANYTMFRETQRKMDSLERSVRDLRSELSARVELGAMRRGLEDIRGLMERSTGAEGESASEALASLRKDQQALVEKIRDLKTAIDQGLRAASEPKAASPAPAPQSSAGLGAASLGGGEGDLGFGGLSLGDDSLSLGGFGGLGEGEGGLSLGFAPSSGAAPVVPPVPAPTPTPALPPAPATADVPAPAAPEALSIPTFPSVGGAFLPPLPTFAEPSQPEAENPLPQIPPAEAILPALPISAAAPEPEAPAALSQAQAPPLFALEPPAVEAPAPAAQVPAPAVPEPAAPVVDAASVPAAPEPLPPLPPIEAPAPEASAVAPVADAPEPPAVPPPPQTGVAAERIAASPSVLVIDRRAIWAAAAAAGLVLVAWVLDVVRPIHRQNQTPAAASGFTAEEQRAIDAVRLHRVDPAGKTVEEALSALEPAGELSQRWQAARSGSGFDVAFTTDRVDPETGGPLVYRFRVDGDAVSGSNLPARAILQEP